MVTKELSIFASTIVGKFLIFNLSLDEPRLMIIKLAMGVHIEIAALQTVNTFPYLLLGNTFLGPFIIQKLVKNLLKTFYHTDRLKAFFQLVYSHRWNRCYFILFLWIS
jgi:hypothetical protein